jgi:hypothetical protein
METTAKKADLTMLRMGNGPSVAELQAMRAANDRAGFTGADLERFDALMDLRWALTWWGFASVLLVLFMLFNSTMGWDALEGPRSLFVVGWVFTVAVLLDCWRRWKRSLRRPMAVPRL